MNFVQGDSFEICPQERTALSLRYFLLSWRINKNSDTMPTLCSPK